MHFGGNIKEYKMGFPAGHYVFYLDDNLKGISCKYGKTNAWYSQSTLFPQPLPNPNKIDVIHTSPTAIACDDDIYCFFVDKNNRAYGLLLQTANHNHDVVVTEKIDLGFNTEGAITPYAQGNVIYLFYRDSNNIINWATCDKRLRRMGGGPIDDMKTGDDVSIASAGDGEIYIIWSNYAISQTSPTLSYRKAELRGSGPAIYQAMTNTYKSISYSPSAVYCNIPNYAPFLFIFYQGGSYSRSLKVYHKNLGVKNPIRFDGEYTINGVNIYTSPSATNGDDPGGSIYVCYVDNSSRSKYIVGTAIHPMHTISPDRFNLNVQTAKANASPFVLQI